MPSIIECESCAEGGFHGIPAVGHSKNVDWSGYDLCQECIDEYDRRAPINAATVTLPIYHCLRCGHQWVPRRAEVKPGTCPKCKSPYWSKPRKQKEETK